MSEALSVGPGESRVRLNYVFRKKTFLIVISTDAPTLSSPAQSRNPGIHARHSQLKQ